MKGGSSMNTAEVILSHIEEDWSVFQEVVNTNKTDECRQIIKKFISDLSIYCSVCPGMSYEALTVEQVNDMCRIGNEQAVVDMLNDQYVSEGIKALAPQINLQEIATYYSVKGKGDSISNLLSRAEGNTTFNAMNPPVDSYSKKPTITTEPIQYITGFTSATGVDNSWGKERLMDLFCQVYMKSSHKFTGMSLEQAKELVEQMTETRDQLVFSLIEKDEYNKGIPNGNLVTIHEALLWTAVFVSAGVNQKVLLAYVREETDDDDKVVMIETTQPEEYNAVVIAPYPEIGKYVLDSKTKLDILSLTVDTYSVGVRSTKGA